MSFLFLCDVYKSEMAGKDRNCFLPLVLTGLNWLAETPSGKNWQKTAITQMTNAVGFLLSNDFKCTNVCLDGIRTYCALCPLGFLVGDQLKCAYMVDVGTTQIFFIRINLVSESFDSTQLMTHNGFTGIDSNQLMTQNGFLKIDSNRLMTQKASRIF